MAPIFVKCTMLPSTTRPAVSFARALPSSPAAFSNHNRQLTPSMLEAYATGVMPCRDPAPPAACPTLEDDDAELSMPGAWCCVPAMSPRPQRAAGRIDDDRGDADATVHIVGRPAGGSVIQRSKAQPCNNAARPQAAGALRRCVSFLVGGMMFATWRPCAVPGAAGVQIRC